MAAPASVKRFGMSPNTRKPSAITKRFRIDEWRQHGGRRQAVGGDQEIVTEAADHTCHHHEGDDQGSLGVVHTNGTTGSMASAPTTLE